MSINSGKPTWDIHQLVGNPEHDLFRSVISEYTDISGILCRYYIRKEVDSDYLYGESVKTSYDGPFETKLVYEPISDQSSLTTGFGVNSEETISFASIPKFTFSRDVSAGYHPKPGDAVVIIWDNKYDNESYRSGKAFEIADVHEEEKIFQLKKDIWGFVLKPYRFSDESPSAREISRFVKPPTKPLNKDMLLNTDSEPLSAFGDNDELENESNDIFDYGDSYDGSIYGY